MTGKYIYIDENGVEYNCKNSAVHDRLWRDRFLNAAELNYSELAEIKNKIVTVQVHAGEYVDKNISSENTVTTESVFLSVLIEGAIVVLADGALNLEVEFKTEAFKIPIDKHRSNPLKKTNALNVQWIGCTIWQDDIWETQNIDSDRPGKGINCQPEFRAICTSASEFDRQTSDYYLINVSIVLPNGQAIGDLDPEDTE